MKVAIEDLPAHHVAYMRVVGPYGPETIVALWARFIGWTEGRGLLTADALKLGIAHDNPRMVAPEHCRYDACLVVPPDFVGNDAVSVTDLAGWKVGLTEFVGTAPEIPGAGDALWASLVEAGHKPHNPFIEIYRGDPAVAGRPGAFKCQLCFALG